MEGLLTSQFGELGIIIAVGVLILVLFIVIRFFKMIFSSAFLGFLLSLFSYFVYDYIFVKVPLIACVAFLLCVTGFANRGFIGKLFALLGTIFSAYLILGHLGIFFTI